MISGHIIILIGLAILGSFICLALVNKKTLKTTTKISSTLLVVATVILMYQGLHMIYGWSAPKDKLPTGKAMMLSYYPDEENDKIYIWLISPKYEYDYILPQIIELINHRQPRGIVIQYNEETHKQLEQLKQMSGGNPIKIEIKDLKGKPIQEDKGENTFGAEHRQYILPDVEMMEK